MKPSFLTIFLIAILILLYPGCKQTGNPEDEFVGMWFTLKGDLDAYSFLKDETNYIFIGIKGMRPVVYGRWKIEKKNFIITMDNGKKNEYSFSLADDTLTFDEGDEIYTRTIPLEVKYPEVKILMALSKGLKVKFSDPQPSDLLWAYKPDSTERTREFSLRSFSISAASTLSSGDLKRISDYIIDYGFEMDTKYSTKSCNGYWDINQVVTLCTMQDKVTSGDSIQIKVTSGVIMK